MMEQKVKASNSKPKLVLENKSGLENFKTSIEKLFENHSNVPNNSASNHILSNDTNKPKKKKFSLYEEFDIGEKLGEGASSIVRKIIRKSDKKVFALKTYKIADKWPTANAEGTIIEFLNHENIIKFYKCCKTKSTVRYPWHKLNLLTFLLDSSDY